MITSDYSGSQIYRDRRNVRDKTYLDRFYETDRALYDYRLTNYNSSNNTSSTGSGFPLTNSSTYKIDSVDLKPVIPRVSKNQFFKYMIN